MKKHLILFLLAAAGTLSSRADYPIFHQRYTADPTGVVYGGRLWLYCSHDRFEPGTRYIMNDVTLISTDDLKNWTDHSEVFSHRDSR